MNNAIQEKIIFLHCIIHQEVLCKCVLKMSHVVDTVTKVVYFIRVKSLNHRQFVSLLDDTESGQADLLYHTNMRWLSLGKVLKRVTDLKSEIAEFLQMKWKYVDFPQLQDKEWLADFVFTVDIMALMNELNSKLQGKGRFAHQMYSLVKAFKGKWLLLTRQVEAKNLTHLPILLVCSLSDDQQEKYTSLLCAFNSVFSSFWGKWHGVWFPLLSPSMWITLPLTCSDWRTIQNNVTDEVLCISAWTKLSKD